MSYLKNDLYFSGALIRNEIHEEEVIGRCLYDSASQLLLDLGYVKYPVDNLDNYLCFNKNNPKHLKYIQ